LYSNIQVTFDASPANARSESVLAINPFNTANMVGASKRFTNPATYEFSLATYYTFDGGNCWKEAPPLQLGAGWGGISDPALAWDGAGNVYLVALPFPPGVNTQIGIAIYRSSDGGQNWSAPNLIHTSSGDDKQWAAGDNTPSSPHFGNVYAVWDDGSQLAFARSVNNGASWIGVGNQPAGSSLLSGSFAPQVTVAPDGTVYIIWTAGSQIRMVVSTNGGNSFSSPIIAASGITPLTSPPLTQAGGFPQLPGGKFRVLTLGAGCAGSGQTIVVAWADLRDGVSRIYYAYSHNRGSSWLSPASGQKLLPGALGSGSDQHEFHPQLARRPDGSLACSFYEFGPKWQGGPPLIDVELTVSTNQGASFGWREKVTDRAWDPTIDAPLSHGNPGVTFIGEYFGLAGSPYGWYVFWTDTRTGVQEMFFGSALRLGPWVGTQWTYTMGANQTIDFYTWGWPAAWHVLWTVMPTTPRAAGPQLRWKVQVERSEPCHLVYHIFVTNLSNAPLGIEGRYAILAIT
jgi:hypothetical protein